MSAETDQTEIQRYRFGRHVLGPIFSAFAHLLIKDAKESRIGHLAFIARDGELLMSVTERLALSRGANNIPQLSYIYLSRMAVSLPGQCNFRTHALTEYFAVQAGAPTAQSFLAYFGLCEERYVRHLDRHGLTLESPTPSPTTLAPLMQDSEFLLAVSIDRSEQTALLEAYLRQLGMLKNTGWALVDIGWRGSILTSLTNAFSKHGGFSTAFCFLLGYWNEFAVSSSGNPSPIRGLLTDQQRSRNILEGSAHYLALLLEAISRADHGTVSGYRRIADGSVVPILSAAVPQRAVEQMNHLWRAPMRKGILDFADHDAASFLDGFHDSNRLRRAVQKRMLRLAFFPTAEEIDAVKNLTHTEGHAILWSAALLEAERPSPYTSPRRWLSGLQSPWRGAYIATTGGFPASLMYFFSEVVMSVSPDFKRWLRNLALRISKRRHEQK